MRRLKYAGFALFAFGGCHVPRHLPEGQWLVESQEIAWLNEDPGATPLKGEAVLRLAENRKTLGVRLHLRVHEAVRPERLERAQLRREEKGKDAEGGLRHWMVHEFGEAPVSWDATAGDRTLRNLEALARRAGYLDASGRIELDTSGGRQQARVLYELDLGPLWRIGQMQWVTEGAGIEPLSLMQGSPIQPGRPFDVDALEAERLRIAELLQSRGYAEFDAAYVAFVADTLGVRSSGRFSVPLSVVVRPAEASPPRPHQRMRLGEIAVMQPRDSAAKPLRDPVLEHLISLAPGELYNRKALETTYRRLMRIPAISRIEMPTQSRVDSTGQPLVDVEIRLWQRPRFGLLTELDFTRTDVRYGPLLRASWTDRNVSGRGDRLEWTAGAGISSTRPFSYTEGALVPNSGEWSVEANYSMLGIPPLGLHRLKQSNAARSEVSLAFRRESRPDYFRRSLGVSYGFEFVENESRNSLFNIDLIEFTYIDLEVEDAFLLWLDGQSNAFLKSRFQDYAAPLTRVQWRTGWNEDVALAGGVRTSFEWSGQLLHELSPVLGLPQNEEGAYLVAGVPFAQFVRWEQEVRLGSEPAPKGGQWMARAFFGMAWLGENLGSLPYDRSFFGGGVNGLRGWATRDLGPGGVVDPDEAGVIRGLGDWRAEFNVEYRERLTESFILALFLDAGNVWMRPMGDTSQAVEATWQGGTWQTVAFNTGLGLRWDFGFFLLRLDGGLRLHDPTQPLGQRWIGQTKARGAFHIGIGHPF